MYRFDYWMSPRLGLEMFSAMILRAFHGDLSPVDKWRNYRSFCHVQDFDYLSYTVLPGSL